MGDRVYWRADRGYQTVPEDLPRPPTHSALTVQVQQQANMSYYPSGPWMYQYQYQYQYQQPTSWLQAPVPLGGLATPPPPYAQAPQAYLQPPPPPPPQVKKKDAPKKEEKKKPANPDAPPALPQHANYMYEREHTMLHIFKKAAPVWAEKYQGQQLTFKIFKVGVNFTAKMVIEKTLRKGGDDCKGWALTEVVESGDGCWLKVSLPGCRQSFST